MSQVQVFEESGTWWLFTEDRSVVFKSGSSIEDERSYMLESVCTPKDFHWTDRIDQSSWPLFVFEFLAKDRA